MFTVSLTLYSCVLYCSLEQLELIEYVIAENLADILKGLSQLKKFSVWTNTETRVRTPFVCTQIHLYMYNQLHIHTCMQTVILFATHTNCIACMLFLYQLSYMQTESSHMLNVISYFTYNSFLCFVIKKVLLIIYYNISRQML